MIVLIEYNLY